MHFALARLRQSAKEGSLAVRSLELDRPVARRRFPRPEAQPDRGQPRRRSFPGQISSNGAAQAPGRGPGWGSEPGPPAARQARLGPRRAGRPGRSAPRGPPRAGRPLRGSPSSPAGSSPAGIAVAVRCCCGSSGAVAGGGCTLFATGLGYREGHFVPGFFSLCLSRSKKDCALSQLDSGQTCSGFDRLSVITLELHVRPPSQQPAATRGRVPHPWRATCPNSCRTSLNKLSPLVTRSPPTE